MEKVITNKKKCFDKIIISEILKYSANGPLLLYFFIVKLSLAHQHIN